jgi:hypothetical protein
MDSPLSRPPGGRWIEGRYLGCPERHQMAALVRIASDLRAILADACNAPVHEQGSLSAGGRCSGPRSGGCRSQGSGPRDRDTGVQSVAEGRRGLSRSLVPSMRWFHATHRQVSFLPSLGRALRRMPCRTSVNALARFGAHLGRMRRAALVSKPLRAALGTASTHFRSWMLISQPGGRGAREHGENPQRAKFLFGADRSGSATGSGSPRTRGG